jgi:hypothetical protein
MKTILIIYAWQGLALFEFLLIVFLLVKHRKKRENTLEKNFKKFKKNEVDMDALMKDMHHSKDLYKELSRKYHPDRFVGSILESESEELFKLIQENKTNFNKLEEIKIQAINTLKI